MAAAAPALVIAAIAAATASAGMQVYAGMQAKAAADTEANAYKSARTQAKVQALDAEAQRRTELNNVLSAQAAVASKMGIDMFASGSFRAIERDSISNAGRDIAAIKLQGRAQYAQYSLAKDQARMAGRAALFSSISQAAATMSGGFMTAASMGKGGPAAGGAASANKSTIGQGAR